MKPGDKVWVLCEVVEVPGDGTYRINNECFGSFWVANQFCKPVEPEAVEQTTKKEPTEAQKIAERTLKAIWATHPKPEPDTVIKQSLNTDAVNPSHYKQGGIECVEAIKAALGARFMGYLSGNVLKYLWRWPNKGGIEDLKKARWYLDRLIKEEEAK